MDDIGQFSKCLDQLEATHRAMVQIQTRTDAGRKRDVLEERRKIPARLTDLQQAGVKITGRQGFDQAGFEQRLSEVRREISRHQSEWSAVMLDDHAGYSRSVGAVARKVWDFISWARAMVAAMAR